MASRGLALTDYSWCKYVFAKCQPNEYIYRIELLENPPTHPESIKYINFMEDSGIEHIASYMRWVYFRKKAADGTFDIYSDIESRIKHYKRILLFWTGLACAELLIGVSNIMIGFINKRTFFSYVNLAGGFLCTIIGLALFVSVCFKRKKIKSLTHEKMIRE